MAEKKTTKNTKLNKKASVVKESKASKSAASKSASKKTTKNTEQKNLINKKDLPNVLLKFRNDVKPDLMKKYQFTTPMAVPKLVKIVINVGLGEALLNSKITDTVITDLEIITGQKPVIRRARKAIAGFKLREGQIIGVMVTLRGHRMYEFFDRLVNTALPRIRDFRGVSPNSFDGRGNYALGLREQVIFPEIDYTAISSTRGLQIIIVTSAREDDHGRSLLDALGMPFQNNI
tara:strand:+ start:798 stop:1496 length:699 start_codon:yes stop_codon:yes gene_type:complete